MTDTRHEPADVAKLKQSSIAGTWRHERKPSDPMAPQARPLADAQEQIEMAVEAILGALGEDLARPGLKDTPRRVAKMYLDIFGGLAEDPGQHLETQFEAETPGGLVLVKDITFFSMCEHHLLPFFGRAHIAYIPRHNRVAGLSKFARVVATLSKRPQMQERLTNAIANVIAARLNPTGVLVLLEASHMCMAMRGIRSEQALTTTLVTNGVFAESAERRNEALKLIYGNCGLPGKTLVDDVTAP
jgi:GTP cyclohydrolase I